MNTRSKQQAWSCLQRQYKQLLSLLPIDAAMSDEERGAEEPAAEAEEPQPLSTPSRHDYTQDREWADFLDELQSQSPMPFFDEDSTNLAQLDYQELLDFSHMSTPHLGARQSTSGQNSGSSNDTLAYGQGENSFPTTNDFVARVTEAGVPEEIFMNPYRIHTRSHRTIPVWVIESDKEEVTEDDSAQPPANDVTPPASPGVRGSNDPAQTDQPDATSNPPALDLEASSEVLRERFQGVPSQPESGKCLCSARKFKQLI